MTTWSTRMAKEESAHDATANPRARSDDFGNVRLPLDRVQHERRNRSERHDAASRRQRVATARRSLASCECVSRGGARDGPGEAARPHDALHRPQVACMVPEQPPEEDVKSSPFPGNSTAAETMASRPTPTGGHRVDRRARAIGEQRARAQQRVPRMWTDRRQHRVMAGQRRRPSCPPAAGRRARHVTPASVASFSGDIDERRDLVPSRAGEIEDLACRFFRSRQSRRVSYP